MTCTPWQSALPALRVPLAGQPTARRQRRPKAPRRPPPSDLPRPGRAVLSSWDQLLDAVELDPQPSPRCSRDLLQRARGRWCATALQPRCRVLSHWNPLEPLRSGPIATTKRLSPRSCRAAAAQRPISPLLSPPGQPARRHGSPNGPRRPSPRSYPSRKANASSTSASSPISSRVATSASPVEMDHVSPEEQVRRYLQGCHGIPASPPNFAFALFRKLGGWDPRLRRQGRSDTRAPCTSGNV